MTIPTFIDVDGVLAAMVEQLALDHGESLEGWPLGQYRAHVVWNKTHEGVWGHTDTVDWWANLPLYRHAQGLVAFFENPVLLTAPMGPNSYAGKALWARKHFPDVPLIIANDKHLIARPGVRLIDDSDKNIEAWKKAGGAGYLWPRPWNSHGSRPDVKDFGRAHLDEAFDHSSLVEWLWGAGL